MHYGFFLKIGYIYICLFHVASAYIFRRRLPAARCGWRGVPGEQLRPSVHRHRGQVRQVGRGCSLFFNFVFGTKFIVLYVNSIFKIIDRELEKKKEQVIFGTMKQQIGVIADYEQLVVTLRRTFGKINIKAKIDRSCMRLGGMCSPEEGKSCW